jgi:hypothetical protein
MKVLQVFEVSLAQNIPYRQLSRFHIALLSKAHMISVILGSYLQQGTEFQLI